MWDLRNSVSPVKQLVSHTKGKLPRTFMPHQIPKSQKEQPLIPPPSYPSLGVLAMAWCPCDSGLLLSCGKDNRTLCWDTVSGEVLYELPAGTNWNFDLQWSPGARGLLSTSSFDGTVSIYNIEVGRRSWSLHGLFFWVFWDSWH